jgi:carbonic anhydrase/acetyltransferase-like protein (isoleucine patch superfamily)
MVYFNIAPNPVTSFMPAAYMPNINKTAHIHPYASVIGAVIMGDNVMVAPFASIRGDEGTPIFIGKGSNIQDGVNIHGLKQSYVNHDNRNYSVYIGENVSLAHQSQVHGPAKIGNNVFVGMQSLIFKSEIADNVVIEPSANIIGVKIPPNRYVPAGETIKTQQQADALPVITPDYKFRELNHEVTSVNKELASGYNYLAAYPPAYYLNRF